MNGFEKSEEVYELINPNPDIFDTGFLDENGGSICSEQYRNMELKNSKRKKELVPDVVFLEYREYSYCTN